MNIQKMMMQAQKQLAKTQAELAEKSSEVTAGGGKITLVVTGGGDITSIKISKDAVDPNDVEFLEDLVLTGVKQAIEKGREMQQQEMGKIGGGLGLPPGLF